MEDEAVHDIMWEKTVSKKNKIYVFNYRSKRNKTGVGH